VGIHQAEEQFTLLREEWSIMQKSLFEKYMMVTNGMIASGVWVTLAYLIFS